MIESIFDRLREIDDEEWLAACDALMDYVLTHASVKSLPHGFTADDIFSMALESLAPGDDTDCPKDRTWNPDKCTLQQFLIGVARSLLSNHGLFERKSVADRVWTPADELELQATGEDKESICTEIIEKLYIAADGDTELDAFVMALECGHCKPREIAEQTGISADRVYELKRKLVGRLTKLGMNRTTIISESISEV